MIKQQPGPVKDEGQSNAVKALRLRAEEAFRAKSASDRPPPGEDARVFHELEVHQIELEMQVDELRQTQDELEASRAKYFGFYNLAPVGYFTLGERDMVLEANITSANLLGMEKSHITGQHFTPLIAAEDRDIYYLYRKKLHETGTAQPCELRMVRPDGALFWARLDASVFAATKNGPPVCHIVMTDITERKVAEEKLRTSERAFSDAQRIGHIGSWEMDLQTMKSPWSGELYRLFGFEPGAFEPTYDKFMALIHPDYKQTVVESLSAMLSGKLARVELDIKIIRSDGQERVFRDELEVVADTDGKPVKLKGIMRDITERKETEEKLKAAKEEAEAATKLKDKFVSLAAHDLRAPLASMLLLQKVTMANHTQPQCNECQIAFGMTVNTCESMIGMTDEILESVRLQGGRFRLNRKICNVKNICDCVMEDLAYLARTKDVALNGLNLRICGGLPSRNRPRHGVVP